MLICWLFRKSSKAWLDGFKTGIDMKSSEIREMIKAAEEVATLRTLERIQSNGKIRRK